MLKRFFALLAVIALFVALAACIKKPAEDGGDKPANEGEGEFTILPVEDDNYQRPVVVPDEPDDGAALDPNAPVSHDVGDVAPPEYPHDANALYGSWRLTKVLAYGSTGTYSEEEAKALVGKILTFSEDKAEVLTDAPDSPVLTIEKPEYTETEIDGETFYAQFRVGFPQVEIAYEAVPAIEITGEDGAASVVLFTAQDKIVMIAGGTFFELERVVK